MTKLAFKFVLPITILCFATMTKWWFALPTDASGTYFIGFPFPYACNGWHTSMSIQFFILELLVDFLVYYLFWFLVIYLVQKIFKPLVIGRIFSFVLIGLSIIVLGLAAFIMSNKDNLFYFKRPFEVGIFETGYKFMWQKDKQVNAEYYQFKKRN